MTHEGHSLGVYAYATPRGYVFPGIDGYIPRVDVYNSPRWIDILRGDG